MRQPYDTDDRTPAFYEAQRQAALSALDAALAAIRYGMLATMETKLLLAAAHLHAMAPSEAA